MTRALAMSPGPGQYTSRDVNNYKSQAPIFGFGTASRDQGGFIQNRALSPGPGAYNHFDFTGTEGAK